MIDRFSSQTWLHSASWSGQPESCQPFPTLLQLCRNPRCACSCQFMVLLSRSPLFLRPAQETLGSESFQMFDRAPFGRTVQCNCNPAVGAIALSPRSQSSSPIPTQISPLPSPAFSLRPSPDRSPARPPITGTRGRTEPAGGAGGAGGSGRGLRGLRTAVGLRVPDAAAQGRRQLARQAGAA
jgi:hypothetical protein